MIKTILPLLILIILTIIKTVLAQNYAIPAPTDIPGFPQPNSTNSTQGQGPTQGPTQGPNYEYTKLLAYSLYFYEAQRSGKLPPNNRVSWRHDSALSDGSDVNLDLTGGYYDAGDHLKFTFPLSWTITSLSWGAYEWYDGYVAANQTTEIRDMIKWGTDWLIKAHSDQSVLYVMIGSEDIDHNYWGPDTDIPYPRPSLQINSTARGTDAAAEAAAAMAAASLFFKDKVQDIEYSNILFNHSQQLYDLASITPFVTYQTSVPEVNNLYASTTYNDELVWSSLWLYKLTKNATYFDIAAGYFKQFQLSGNNDVINWDSKTGATYILFVQCAIELNRNDVDTWKAEAERYLDTVASQSDRCKLTKGGLFYCNGDSDAASLNPALNAAFASLLYSNLSSTTSKRDNYIDFAMSQINYLFGKNPMKIPYIVGVHPNSPQNPHHSGAQGGNDINGPTLNIIYGGIVGGPDKHDKYKDKRADYIQSEVALDYNAPFQNIMAYQVINSQDDPYYVTLPPGRGSVSELNVALVVSLVVIGVLIIVGICIFIYWRKKRGKSINIFRCFKK